MVCCPASPTRILALHLMKLHMYFALHLMKIDMTYGHLPFIFMMNHVCHRALKLENTLLDG